MAFIYIEINKLYNKRITLVMQTFSAKSGAHVLMQSSNWPKFQLSLSIIKLALHTHKTKKKQLNGWHPEQWTTQRTCCTPKTSFIHNSWAYSCHFSLISKSLEGKIKILFLPSLRCSESGMLLIMVHCLIHLFSSFFLPLPLLRWREFYFWECVFFALVSQIFWPMFCQISLLSGFNAF